MALWFHYCYSEIQGTTGGIVLTFIPYPSLKWVKWNASFLSSVKTPALLVMTLCDKTPMGFLFYFFLWSEMFHVLLLGSKDSGDPPRKFSTFFATLFHEKDIKKKRKKRSKQSWSKTQQFPFLFFFWKQNREFEMKDICNLNPILHACTISKNIRNKEVRLWRSWTKITNKNSWIKITDKSVLFWWSRSMASIGNLAILTTGTLLNNLA